MRILAKLRREILIGLSRIGLKQATVYRDDKKFKIPLINGMGRFLFVTYEPWRKKVLRTIAKMNLGTVLDIGVNVGQTMLDMKEIIPEANYYGFEPNPACIFYTNELIRLNGFTNTSILPFGLGERSELNTLNSSRWDDASSSVLPRDGDTYSSVVYIKQGDEFIESEGIENISFIKVDTEGFEFQVLKGLKQTILKNQPIIFCEVFAGKDENRDLYDFLKELDYQVYEQDTEFQLKKMDQDNIFNNPCHDYIFAPRNKTEEFEKHF